MCFDHEKLIACQSSIEFVAWAGHLLNCWERCPAN